MLASIRQVFALSSALLALSLPLQADPIPVRHVQGASRAFLILKDTSGKRLAYGDLIQTVHGARVTSRLTFHFRDGSLDDDLTTYTQQGVFKLISDHHIQKGPSFPKPIDSLVDAASGIVTSRSIDKDGKEKVDTQHLDMPPDVSNGMALTLIGNIAFQVPKTVLGYVAATTSSARLVHLVIHPVAEEPVYIGGSRRKAMDFAIHIELGGITGVIAPLVGKQPDDVHVWILGGEVPVILATEGQLYQGGPIWRIEIEKPEWPNRSKE